MKAWCDGSGWVRIIYDAGDLTFQCRGCPQCEDNPEIPVIVSSHGHPATEPEGEQGDL